MVGGAEVPSPAWSALAGAGLTLVEATSAITLHLGLLERQFKVSKIDTENINGLRSILGEKCSLLGG